MRFLNMECVSLEEAKTDTQLDCVTTAIKKYLHITGKDALKQYIPKPLIIILIQSKIVQMSYEIIDLY